MNRKGDMEAYMKYLLWIIVFVLLFFGARYLLKTLTGG